MKKTNPFGLFGVYISPLGAVVVSSSMQPAELTDHHCCFYGGPSVLFDKLSPSLPSGWRYDQFIRAVGNESKWLNDQVRPHVVANLNSVGKL